MAVQSPLADILVLTGRRSMQVHYPFTSIHSPFHHPPSVLTISPRGFTTGVDEGPRSESVPRGGRLGTIFVPRGSYVRMMLQFDSAPPYNRETLQYARECYSWTYPAGTGLELRDERDTRPSHPGPGSRLE